MPVVPLKAVETLSPEQEQARVDMMTVLRSRIECHEADELFVGSWEDLSGTMIDIARTNGFASNDIDEGMALALIHSEISEVLEAVRAGNPPSKKLEGFTEVEDELADIVIRVMSYASARGHRVAEAIIAKAIFNSTRPYKHGKLF